MVLSKFVLLLVVSLNGDTISSAVPYDTMRECLIAKDKVVYRLDASYEATFVGCIKIEQEVSI